MQFSRAMLTAIAAIAVSLALASRPADAQQYTVQSLHTFAATGIYSGDSGEAIAPDSSLTLAPDGTLYGQSQIGGVNGTGSIYSYKNGVETVLYSFEPNDDTKSNVYGADPTGAIVVGSDGALYGACLLGGTNDTGTIYRWKAGAISLLHTFPSGGTGGVNLAIYPGDVLYGTTYSAGADTLGQLFKIQNGIFTDLYDFTGSVTGGVKSGIYPSSAPILTADGALYGTTQYGGTGSSPPSLPPNIGSGTIYKFANGVLTTLYSFGVHDANGHPIDGIEPGTKLVMAPDGTLYGTTPLGIDTTTGHGTLFSFKDGVLTTLHDFQGQPDGGNPVSNLAAGPDGSLYGTTVTGGANNTGEVYSYKAGVFRNIYSFDAYDSSQSATNTNGASPAGVTLGSDGTLYVVAQGGGANQNGAILALTSTSWTERSIAAGSSGETRLLWTQTSGAASIWTVAANGHITFGPTYGPFTGWTPRKITIGANGNTYLWWTNTNGSMSFWICDPSGNAIWQGSAVGPYASWTPVDFSANPDGTERVLWTKTTGEASVWTIAANDTITFSPTFGPFANWSAEHVIAGPSGSSRVLWNTAQGAASVWTVASGGAVSYSPTFGPYTGWTCVGIGLASDGKTRLQWNNGASTSYWTVPSSGPVVYSPVWGPFSSWNPDGFSVAADGTVRLFWSQTTGQVSFWNVGSAGIQHSPTYGPY